MLCHGFVYMLMEIDNLVGGMDWFSRNNSFWISRMIETTPKMSSSLFFLRYRDDNGIIIGQELSRNLQVWSSSLNLRVMMLWNRIIFKYKDLVEMLGVSRWFDLNVFSFYLILNKIFFRYVFFHLILIF